MYRCSETLAFFLFLSSLLFSLSAANDEVHKLLWDHGIPGGILPDAVSSFNISAGGDFSVELHGPCYIQFDYMVYYDRFISGNLKYGSITSLKGVQVQKFVLWLNVDEIRVDLPPSDYIYFHVGMINKKLDVKQFKKARSCRNPATFQEIWERSIRQKVCISMKLRATIHSGFSSIIPKFFHHYLQCRGIVKVRLKWVKNRSLDHIIDTETDLKAACLLKDAIKRSSGGFLASNTIANWQKLLGLTVPVLRFMRRYPTLFHEFPHPKYPSLPCFRLTDTALMLHSQEESIHQTNEPDTVERLCKVLMMMKTRMVPLQSLSPLKWDLGLPDDYHKTLIPKYLDHFRVIKASNGLPCLKLGEWREELAVSALQTSNERGDDGEYREFKRGKSALTFPMSFPRGYGGQKKVKAWMEEFQKLPYISPYEDSRRIDPNSELMEKRAVGVLHEFLSLTIHKKTKRNYLRSLREELNLPHKFTRIFTRYPGIFYLSLKCKTTTVAIKEGYRRGKLATPHPLARIREKYNYVMRTGLLYRGKGMNMIPQKDVLLDDGENTPEQEESAEEEPDIDDECNKGETSEEDLDSDDED